MLSKMLSCKYRSEVSQYGYTLDVLKSALQKYLRRGKAFEATYVMREFLSFRECLNDPNNVSNVKRINTNFIHRLQIIVLEDIGAQIYEQFDEIYETINEIADLENEDAISPCLNLSIDLCRSIKSREPSFWKSYWLDNAPKTFKLNNTIVSYLKNKGESEALQHMCSYLVTSIVEKEHSAVGWALRIAKEEVKCKYLNRKDSVMLIFYIFSLECMPSLVRKVAKSMIPWYNDLKNLNEAFLTYIMPLLVYLKSENGDFNVMQHQSHYVHNKNILFYKLLDFKKPLEFDDYVYDKHVKNSVDRTTDYFVNVSSLVIPEDITINKKYKSYYINVRCNTKLNLLSNVASERDLFDFIVRAQLNTSDSKADTYYAIEKTSGLIKFVKGPLTKEEVDNAMLCHTIKTILNFPVYGIETKFLKCDMFTPEQTVLGIRKNMSEGWFLICNNLFDWKRLDDIPITVKSSKLYKNVEVIDKEKFNDVKFVSVEHINYNFAKIICLRSFMGVQDPALRNFLINTQTNDIYSVDENVINKEFILNYGNDILKKLDKIFRECNVQLSEEMTSWVKKCKDYFKGENEEVNLMIQRTIMNFKLDL